MKKVHWGKVYNPIVKVLFHRTKLVIFTFLNHTKLSTHIPNKKELHITAHASTPVGANEWTTCLPC